MRLLTGDTHGDIISRLKCLKKQKGYVIVLGDFGLLWNGGKDEKFTIDWLNKQTFITLFVDGNHENHDMIDALETVDMFDSSAGKVSDNIFHLKRGNVYNIDGKKFLSFGGAASIDYDMRTPGKSWWPQEVATYRDFNNAIFNLEKVDYKIDYIVSHTCPESITSVFGEKIIDDPTSLMLEELDKLCSYKKLFFGHWHVDQEIGDKYHALYKTIKELS